MHLIWMVRKRPKIFTSIDVKSCIFNVHRVVLVMLAGPEVSGVFRVFVKILKRLNVFTVQ